MDVTTVNEARDFVQNKQWKSGTLLALQSLRICSWESKASSFVDSNPS